MNIIDFFKKNIAIIVPIVVTILTLICIVLFILTLTIWNNAGKLKEELKTISGSDGTVDEIYEKYKKEYDDRKKQLEVDIKTGKKGLKYDDQIKKEDELTKTYNEKLTKEDKIIKEIKDNNDSVSTGTKFSGIFAFCGVIASPLFIKQYIDEKKIKKI